MIAILKGGAKIAAGIFLFVAACELISITAIKLSND